MPSNKHWTTANIPDQSGKVAVVTGANSGLGLEISRELARKGARVILASRDKAKGEKALADLRRELPSASLEFIPLDLANLASIRQFVTTFTERYPALHILANNAGVMAIPYRKTVDGFEMQFGTNHLGHFALTGLLLPVLLETPNSRIVTTSSMIHRSGKIDFANLNGEAGYTPSSAYGRSKLANLLFAYELQRRLTAMGASTLSLASHPGYASTNLQAVGPQMKGSALQAGLMSVANAVLAQSAAKGALPTLYAATSPDAHGGEYIGPNGLGELRGYPVVVRSNELSNDQALAAKLWSVSEELTGVSFNSLVH